MMECASGALADHCVYREERSYCLPAGYASCRYTSPFRIVLLFCQVLPSRALFRLRCGGGSGSGSISVLGRRCVGGGAVRRGAQKESFDICRLRVSGRGRIHGQRYDASIALALCDQAILIAFSRPPRRCSNLRLRPRPNVCTTAPTRSSIRCSDCRGRHAGGRAQ